MENKENFKKYLTITLIIFIIFLTMFITLNVIQYNTFNKNNNIAISHIINNIKSNYPKADISEIIQMLNNENIKEEDILKEYGININKDSFIMINQQSYTTFTIISIAILCAFFTIIIYIFIRYNKSQNDKITEITKYIEKINDGDYTLNIQDNDEDELSILKNELYKITIMLKEQSANSLNDKIQLKKSLEDISHQLKTPLTSITIMLDNLLDNPDMEASTRNDFIKSIYREISNVNFFIQTLLKLSRFDANTVKFNCKEENIENIVIESNKNVGILCDLKNITIEIIEDKGRNSTNIQIPQVFCDFKWQVEAITNILKNCVEHSESNTKIYISYSENNMYSEIIIQDNGTGIEKEDLKHIFERFYKGKNSNKDSVGIGLSLAKTIIEKDNGYITVESEIGKGTKFDIRYLK